MSMLSIIVVEYFSRPHLDRLLDSVAMYEKEAPIWVSSNSAYAQSDRLELCRRFPQAQFLFNEKNLGYAGGVNRALAQLMTPYAAILNPDVELTEEIAIRGLAPFSEDSRLAVVGPKVLDGSGEPSHTFRRFYTPSYVLARYLCMSKTARFRRIRDYFLMADASRDVFTYVDWVNGGSQFVRMDAYREVGGMDERYFLYMEDMDWCRVFWRAGWRVAYWPGVSLVHPIKYDGTRRGVFGIMSKAARRQIWSYFKYLLKWEPAVSSPAAALQAEVNARRSHLRGSATCAYPVRVC